MAYKLLIVKMLEEISEEDDLIFLGQIYTLVRLRVEKKQKRKEAAHE